MPHSSQKDSTGGVHQLACAPSCLGGGGRCWAGTAQAVLKMQREQVNTPLICSQRIGDGRCKKAEALQPCVKHRPSKELLCSELAVPATAQANKSASSYDGHKLSQNSCSKQIHVQARASHSCRW